MRQSEDPNAGCGIAFGPDEAALAAFWTLNPGDFRDIPGLHLLSEA
jgi:hypothetical protein